MFPSGTIVIDSGAHQVLSHRENGGRLLPAGVVDVMGAFASGQAVRIVVRKRKLSDADGKRTSDEMLREREQYAAGLETPGASGSTTPTKSHGHATDLSCYIDTNAIFEEVEVGRGLANYNSQQITQVKGKKRFIAPYFFFQIVTDVIFRRLAGLSQRYWGMLTLNTSSKTSLFEFQPTHDMNGERYSVQSRKMWLNET